MFDKLEYVRLNDAVIYMGHDLMYIYIYVP